MITVDSAAAPSSVHLRVPGFELMAGVHAAESALPRHSHDLPTLCCVRSGRFTEYYAGKAVDCDARIVKLTPAGEPHWNRFVGTDTYGVRVDVDPDRFAASVPIARLLEERIFLDAATLGGLSDRLLRELDRPDDAAAVAVEGLLLELLARMARVTSPRVDDAPRWLLRADELVRELFRTRLSLADVAAAVDVHPATLARAYRQRYGCTVGDRIRWLRITFAAQQLETTALPIAEIAVRAGFYDQSHFTNAFRRQYAATPARYRASFAGARAAPPVN